MQGILPHSATALALALSSAATTGGEPSAPPALTIAPLRISMAPGQQAAELRLVNAGDAPMGVQVRVFSWRQEEGVDRYAPAPEVAASPSIVRIDPHAVQAIHIVRSNPAVPPGELRYRIVVDQLPQGGDGDAARAATRLQLTLPLFVAAPDASAPRLAATLRGNALTLANLGGRTARLTGIDLVAADGRRWPADVGSARYVLGGSAVTYRVPAFACESAGPVRVAARVDVGDYDAVPAQTCP